MANRYDKAVEGMSLTDKYKTLTGIRLTDDIDKVIAKANDPDKMRQKLLHFIPGGAQVTDAAEAFTDLRVDVEAAGSSKPDNKHDNGSDTGSDIDSDIDNPNPEPEPEPEVKKADDSGEKTYVKKAVVKYGDTEEQHTADTIVITNKDNAVTVVYKQLDVDGGAADFTVSEVTRTENADGSISYKSDENGMAVVTNVTDSMKVMGFTSDDSVLSQLYASATMSKPFYIDLTLSKNNVLSGNVHVEYQKDGETYDVVVTLGDDAESASTLTVG